MKIHGHHGRRPHGRLVIATILTACVGVIVTAPAAQAGADVKSLLKGTEVQRVLNVDGAMTELQLPAVPGMVMRSYLNQALPNDVTTIILRKVKRSSAADICEQELRKAKEQFAASGQECKTYEDRGVRKTVVCYSMEQGSIAVFSADVKANKTLVMVNIIRYKPDGAPITDADLDQAAQDAKALRTAQMAKV